jgi:hypothetical protein
MQLLLIILAIAGGLIASLLLIALFTRKSYRIERAVTIAKPLHEVFDYIRHLKNQDHYNKWVMMDPAMKKDFRGTDGTVGFIYGWDGNKKAGAGEQEIMLVEADSRMDSQVRFIRPFKAIANSFLHTRAITQPNTSQEATRVQWVFSSQLKYPANIFLLLMNVEKTLGKDLEISLNKLKTILEK